LYEGENMIYTLTYSPTIDYLCYLDDLRVGKLNRMNRNTFLYGGKGVNVSQVLNNLGFKNVALGFVAGFTGREIEDGLGKLGIATDFIHLPYGNSRINIKLCAQEETEVNAAGPEVDADSLNKLFDQLKNIGPDDILILGGRQSRGMSSDMYARVMMNLPYRDTKVVIDTEGEMLLNTLPYGPFLIKPNEKELENLFHTEFSASDPDAIVSAAKKLQKMGARNVLVSLGSDGAIMVTEDRQVFRKSAPAGIAVNTVGSGDSMVAGFVAEYLRSGDYENAFVMGIAAGSECAFREGFASGDEIEQLYRLIR